MTNIQQKIFKIFEKERKANITDLDSVLVHFGIKGMKWGVRRKSPSGGRKVSPDYKSAAAIRKKRISMLSNDEIKTLSTRLRLEKELIRLNPPKSTRLKDLVGKFLQKYSNDIVDKAAGAAANKSYDTMVKELKKARAAAKA